MTIKNFSTPISNDWNWEAPKALSQSLWPSWEADFLFRRESLASKLIWNDSSKDKLWLYNLHYFDDLNAFESEDREEFHFQFLDRWLKENPCGYGNAWEPYPLSLRIVNWIKWFSQKNSVDEKYLVSILEQADALFQKLEYHILGNHLFANAKALVFVGSYLKGEASLRYLQKGLDILDKELAEQFLDDGGHFELSPMYHSILLWDLLDLINLSTITNSNALNSRVKKWKLLALQMLDWLQVMLHPDSNISFFNDAAFSIAPSPPQIFAYAKQLGLYQDKKLPSLVTLHESGYSRVNQSSYTLFIDHANIGPDYLPGHGHADHLSFELSVGHYRVFVNSGTSLYGTTTERVRQRGTEAHNTVCIEGENSSEVWSGFRVARRAYSTLHSVISDDSETISIIASHDGYMRLVSKNIHSRSFKCQHNQIIIDDSLSGVVVEAEAHFHVHPEVTVSKITSSTVELYVPDKGNKIIVQFNNQVDILKSSWHPKFSHSITNYKLVVSLRNNKLTTKITIESAL